MNPLDDPEGEFLALCNDEGQYSLWPAFIKVPPGWTAEYGPQSRHKCVEHIETRWTDMRPGSLISGEKTA